MQSQPPCILCGAPRAAPLSKKGQLVLLNQIPSSASSGYRSLFGQACLRREAPASAACVIVRHMQPGFKQPGKAFGARALHDASFWEIPMPFTQLSRATTGTCQLILVSRHCGRRTCLGPRENNLRAGKAKQTFFFDEPSDIYESDFALGMLTYEACSRSSDQADYPLRRLTDLQPIPSGPGGWLSSYLVKGDETTHRKIAVGTRAHFDESHDGDAESPSKDSVIRHKCTTRDWDAPARGPA
ncbi:predicted protein [Plenodomus lingam JN3]|uniref:Uncharacterized protein n=1 Tax=Leptosphaeria maculans (strain JN3 / isolate v23.1.3 / race Av1-4-5-6-7-8) TaxID=985895 RepID=E5A6F3_LEPMJ|nr:predicted protein [Plenodomus lingam JN3]CBX99198.1 predicted protein [Plenodomus lingam JN3]